MRKLNISIEVNGENILVGHIIGNDFNDACFTYADSYLSNVENRAISIILPLQKEAFSSNSTRKFFEGLLPEGFTRRCVAEWMHADENDYLSILAGLGNECLGAIKILDENGTQVPAEYRKLSAEEVQKLAEEGATESAELVTKTHLSLTGASGKVGLYYNTEDDTWYLPYGDAPSTYIVKQSHVRLKKIVANEQLCLMTAKNLGIEIPESFIVRLDNLHDENVLFATKRYDRKENIDGRVINGFRIPYRLHQEDFAQALGISSFDKYERENAGYMKKIFDVVRNYSANPIEDQLKLWDICVFNYLIGNTDNHIKNISLLYSEDLKAIRLAPAYDIISTMIYENSTDNMAMSIGGEYNIEKINRESFEKETANIGLGKKIAMERFDLMIEKFQNAINRAKKELEDQGYVEVNEIYEKIIRNGGIKNYV